MENHIKEKIKQRKKQNRKKRLGYLKKRVLSLLKLGVGLGFSYTPRQRFWVLKDFKKEWGFIKTNRLKEIINEFYNERLVDYEDLGDGSTRVILAEGDNFKLLNFKLDDMKLKPKEKWDGYWRFIMFDIPENKKMARDAFRNKLKSLGVYEFQKSVFVYPFDCREEIDFIIEVFDLRPYV